MIAIVASRELSPTPELIAVLAGLMATTAEPVAIRVSAAGDPASGIEYITSKIAKAVGRSLLRFAADNARGVYRRDYMLVDKSRLVVAFFQPGREMAGGTGHVVKAALDRAKPVEAYSFDEAGELYLLGSDAGGRTYHSMPVPLEALMEAQGS